MAASGSSAPPYGGPGEFASKYRAACLCGRVRYGVDADPLSSELRDCPVGMRLHGAPVQWVAAFALQTVRLDPESLASVQWYSTASNVLCSRLADRASPPWRVRCAHCGSHLAEETADTWLACPTQFEFAADGGRPAFPRSFLPRRRTFAGTRALDALDGLPCFLDGGSTPATVSDFLRDVAPGLDGRSHKGQAGRVAVLGGSVDFAGAPYYAGMTALRTGAELVYILTAEEATGPIKSFSPELMVSEVYRWSHMSIGNWSQEQVRMLSKVESYLPRLHALVIGPGLGRDDRVLEVVGEIITACKARNLPMVIDADGLCLVDRRPDLLEGYTAAVLTPNIMEIRRMAKAFFGEESADPRAVCDRLRGPTVLLKGAVDRMTAPGRPILECDEEGAPRRPGGLGDLLAGSLSVILGWTALRGQDQVRACQAACTLVRRASKAAYAKHRRAMVAPDVMAEVGGVFEELCPAA